MKKTLSSILLVLISAFMLNSCGDSKEAVVDDMIELMQKSAGAAASGDTEAQKKFEEEAKKLEERAKAVGLDPKDPSSMPDDLKKKFEDAMKESMKKAMDKALEKAPEGAKEMLKNATDAVTK